MICPSCLDRPLTSHHRGGIQLDICVKCHGIWLDRGELHVLAFPPPTPSGAVVTDSVQDGPQYDPIAKPDDDRDDDDPDDDDRDDDDRDGDDTDEDDDDDRDERGRRKEKRKKKASIGDRLGEVIDEIFDDLLDF